MLEAYTHVGGDILEFAERKSREAVIFDVTIATRHISLAILLALLTSYAVIAMHAATHLSVDSGECEYCMAYGHASVATDAAHEGVVPDNRSRQLASSHVAPPNARQTLLFLPRGPPPIG